jgi:hypothetical protein
MAKQSGKRKKDGAKADATEGLPPLNLHAAGIDVGSAELDTRRVSELEWMFGKQDAQALKDMQKSIQERLQSEAALDSGAPPEKKRLSANESVFDTGGLKFMKNFSLQKLSREESRQSRPRRAATAIFVGEGVSVGTWRTSCRAAESTAWRPSSPRCFRATPRVCETARNLLSVAS